MSVDRYTDFPVYLASQATASSFLTCSTCLVSLLPDRVKRCTYNGVVNFSSLGMPPCKPDDIMPFALGLSDRSWQSDFCYYQPPYPFRILAVEIEVPTVLTALFS